VDAREDPDFLIVARSDASWIGEGFDETLRRLEAYAAAGADLVFPTGVPPERLPEIRRRTGKPVMIVDLPGATLAIEERAGASLVLYYSFSLLVHFDALDRALARFKSTRDANAVPGLRSRVREFEDFMGYRDFAERARRYSKY
jgi:methylisocitrate lyase